ncbi:unknown [Clostridium sp. CAG:762]|nr:unknown [Clostridium sp. CAG:762]
MYNTSKLFNSTTYLTNDGIQNTDSHMMKNIEWGAVAYLKQSIYGLGITDITINNNSSYYTGGGTGTSYKTNIGQSTSGNITGVYDMSGGAWEYVMGNYNKQAGDSGLTVSGVPAEHIDIYSGTSVAASHLGDATGETAGWYSDSAIFVNSSNPWFPRGGYFFSNDAGVFSFGDYAGEVSDHFWFRSVLSVKE